MKSGSAFSVFKLALVYISQDNRSQPIGHPKPEHQPRNLLKPPKGCSSSPSPPSQHGEGTQDPTSNLPNPQKGCSSPPLERRPNSISARRGDPRPNSHLAVGSVASHRRPWDTTGTTDPTMNPSFRACPGTPPRHLPVPASAAGRGRAVPCLRLAPLLWGHKYSP